MAKKKSKLPPNEEAQALRGDAGAVLPELGTGTPSEASKKSSRVPPKAGQNASPQTLIICRNKHWRYISSFHGPWLQMPFEMLESIANINYNTPRPRPLDPAIVFDLIKIRRLVDEASNLAVRAASDIASPTLTNVHGGAQSAQDSLNAMGIPSPGHTSKLSRERKFRMREQASQKLARAYRLDEIASSVAAMQGVTSLEEVGNLVLQRNPQDPDAKYVHFFHEKIPSRQLAEFTSLQPLTEIISERPKEVEVLRTRATVRIFKEDLEGAIQDLTVALSGCRFHQPLQSPTEEDLKMQESHKSRRRPDVILAEKDQPNSLEGQLLFHRATTYLNLACQQIAGGDWTSAKECQNGNSEKHSGNGVPDLNGKPEGETGEEKSTKEQLESRKLVKTYAKRALRDYTSFISKFEYSPNLPTKIFMEFNARLALAERRARNLRPSDTTSPVEPHTTYSLDQLFAALPPSDLPPYPSQEVVKKGTALMSIPANYEFVTFHPLLADALHSVLLCHCLVQTSSKELLRHAYMVARLVRIIDGSPIFQASRSQSRVDWIEVLKREDNWLQLRANWDTLCDNIAADAIYEYDPRAPTVVAADALVNGHVTEEAVEKTRKKRIHEEAVMHALEDERVSDEASFRAAIAAHTKRINEGDGHLKPPTNGHAAAIKQIENFAELLERQATLTISAPGDPFDPNSVGTQPHAPGKEYTVNTSPEGFAGAYDAALQELQPLTKRINGDDGKDFPICTPRALAISDWVREAPVVPATTRRKKRSKKGKEPPDEAMEKLDLEE